MGYPRREVGRGISAVLNILVCDFIGSLCRMCARARGVLGFGKDSGHRPLPGMFYMHIKGHTGMSLSQLIFNVVVIPCVQVLHSI